MNENERAFWLNERERSMVTQEERKRRGKTDNEYPRQKDTSPAGGASSSNAIEIYSSQGKKVSAVGLSRIKVMAIKTTL